MATKKSTEKAPSELDILEVQKGRIEVCVLGETPLITNRLSEKAKHELLMPARKKNATERATILKHVPLDEFRNSPYLINDPAAPTHIAILAASFKKAMMTAALDLPSTKKAQIGRLTWVIGDYASIYGVPQIVLATVRMADMARTPDIRSRAILPRWACRLTVSYVQPLMKAQAVVRLLAAAGMFIGVGDWRNEKGSGTFGSFKLVEPDDPEFLDVVATGGYAAQVAAMESPTAYDEETADLLAWFDGEMNQRKMKGVA